MAPAQARLRIFKLPSWKLETDVYNVLPQRLIPNLSHQQSNQHSHSIPFNRLLTSRSFLQGCAYSLFLGLLTSSASLHDRVLDTLIHSI